jgi:hypothetical protein
MATSPVPRWAREQSPYHRGPTGAGVLALALVVVLVVLALQAVPTTDSGERSQGSLCDQHRGRPAWEAVCEEARRGR